MSENKIIYKIFRVHEWAAAKKSGMFAGSPDDLRDGFIHFSTAEQLRGTIEKYFSAQDEIILASFDAEGFGDRLKWEISRGGMHFPHLYARLPQSEMLQMWCIEKDISGRFNLPAEII
jgi:uncharacterized protein (DUF952 family)